MNGYEKLLDCTKTVKARLKERPHVGIVLGSGLGDLAEQVENPTYVSYNDIPHFPVSTAPGHIGRFVFGRLEGVPVVMMQGRIHLYEGYCPQDCVLPIRLMGLLGIHTLILTNAAGACNETYHVGEFCILQDHISTQVPSPLVGANLGELGPRFPDMTEVYDAEVRTLLRRCGEASDCVMHDGIYVQFIGPAYETPAEIRMAQGMGADMVGMSTVIEAIAAHHMGVRLGAVSLVTNKAAGLGGKRLSEQEVIDEGKLAGDRFQKMIRRLVPLLDAKTN